jgi:hypothetical protein
MGGWWYGQYPRPPRKSPSDHDIATRKWNTVIAVTIDGVTYITYHMPCAFKTPLVMELHGEALLKFILSFDGKVVFGGDMNTKPEDPVYDLMTDKLVDCYANCPPKYTCLSAFNDNPIFEGVLDYIFCRGFDPSEYEAQPITYENDCIVMPDNNNPSDHKMLVVKFRKSSD